MTVHTIAIQQPARSHTVKVNSLAELLKQTGTKILQLREALDINYRTVQRRIREPETITLKELLALSKLLSISEYELVDLIRDEYQRRLATAVGSAASATELP